MKALLKFPTKNTLEKMLKQQASKDFSYPYVGDSQKQPPADYDFDSSRIYIGKGDVAWEKAKVALRRWQQYPNTWTYVYPENAPLETGQNVLVLFHLFGLWWVNGCRIVYTFDEPNYYGFAYGTLPGHVEKGEEVFRLERDLEGNIHYGIEAFSSPAYWLIRSVYPMARMLQKKFARESKEVMKQVG